MPLDHAKVFSTFTGPWEEELPASTPGRMSSFPLKIASCGSFSGKKEGGLEEAKTSRMFGSTSSDWPKPGVTKDRVLGSTSEG